jgi:hypothetical protein
MAFITGGRNAMNIPAWVPELMCMEDYAGDWNGYCSALYENFRNDFVINITYYLKQKICIKKHPLINGQEATFWHIISEGKVEESRTPDLRRCERIKWPKPFIENCNSCSEMKIWEYKRNGDHRITIWFEALEYAVVLSKRKGYLLLWTAFLTTESRKIEYLRKQYDAYKKAEAAH